MDSQTFQFMFFAARISLGIGVVLSVVMICLCASATAALLVCNFMLQPALESIRGLQGASNDMVRQSLTDLIVTPLLERGFMAIAGNMGRLMAIQH